MENARKTELGVAIDTIFGDTCDRAYMPAKRNVNEALENFTNVWGDKIKKNPDISLYYTKSGTLVGEDINVDRLPETITAIKPNEFYVLVAQKVLVYCHSSEEHQSLKN